MVVLFTTIGYSQKASKDYKFFNNSSQSASSEEETTDAPSEPGDPAPIDDYLPLLAIAGAGMALYFGRKKYILTK